MTEKQELRRTLKARRTAHVESIPPSQRGLLFRRPPGALLDLIGEGAVIGAYHEMAGEVPASRYACWFFEHGHRIALPWFAGRGAPMSFRQWDNPFIADALAPDPHGAMQPGAESAPLDPDVVLVPLLGFTASGDRIGYGGGHYDRWLGAHRGVTAIGLAWDCQLEPQLPREPHDIPLSAIVTPTRLYGPF